MEDKQLDQGYLDNLRNFGAQYHGRYSTLWERLLANAVDAIVVGAGLLLVLLASGRGFADSPVLAWRLFDDTVIYLYTIALHAKSGRTLGKQLMGLKVIDKSEAKEISVLQAILRDAFPVLLTIAIVVAERIGTFLDPLQLSVASIGLGWSLLEPLSVLTNRRRRAIHDYLAGTVVVKA